MGKRGADESEHTGGPPRSGAGLEPQWYNISRAALLLSLECTQSFSTEIK
jgi:hypothetical protein